ncbi:LuxR family transcriptional regulator [Bradyrhizobium arachidis]|uniref:LuxR family transcriptional regulator n=1 Tax=Bradyrhizobium arachidis TaxID=858423 RepID=UPI002163F490|nr:LuxR family transcriptional regulator [Bradyrhizobium arachidis]UVO35732.1 LuxR family transcriptional regulator [Bradyrhizobium arachidis]
MKRAIQNFVDRLTQSSDQTALEQSMADVTGSMNLRSFAYLGLPRKPDVAPKLISTYPPSWIAHYMRRQYEAFDPVVRQAIRDTRPFRWGLGFGPRLRSDSERELFEEAAGFGIRYGFTIPIHDHRGEIAIVTFATDRRRSGFEHSIMKRTDVLEVIAWYFHAHARSKFQPDRILDGVSLSPRELECLEWSSRGKSIADIGIILGISRRTAAFHLDNVRAKLGVRTICQAVARLVEANSRR